MGVIEDLDGVQKNISQMKGILSKPIMDSKKQMATFEKAIPIILIHEGGFVDNEFDPGGATNRGITFNVFRMYSKTFNVPAVVDSLKNLTENQAKIIYLHEFWNPMNGDLWSDQQLANIVFDGFVNMGRDALKMIQKELGLYPDGTIGKESLQAITSCNAHELFNKYKAARIQFYLDLVRRKPKLSVFKNGWLNRINGFVYK